PALGLVALATRGIAAGRALASPALVRAARRLIADPRPIATAALAALDPDARWMAGDVDVVAADARTRRAIAGYARIVGDRRRAATLLLGLADDARGAHRDADAEADYPAAIAELAAIAGGGDDAGARADAATLDVSARQLRARALLGRGIVRYRL